MAEERTSSSKKIINEPSKAVDEALEGLVLSNNNLKLLKGHRVVIRADVLSVRARGQVALISGGGSGHEPSHGGFVGRGALTAAVAGDVFTSPPARSILAAIKAVGVRNSGGVLLIVKNYTGDRLNFGMAAERAKREGIKVDMVIVNDDCALSSADKTAGRRGLCGTVFIHKIAGAMAEDGKQLEEIAEAARNAVKVMGTIGVSLSPCSIPGAKPSFHLGDDEMELGLGIHGEKGVERVKLLTAKHLIHRMVEHMTTDSDFKKDKILLRKGDKIGLMVNNLGGTSYLELYIVAREAVHYLKSEKGVEVERIYVGTFMTSVEMAGVSLTLLHLNEERKKYLDSETTAPGWQAVYGDQYSKEALNVTEPANEKQMAEQNQEQMTALGRMVYNCLLKIADTLNENEDKLNSLDRLAGDGDCGSTLKRAAVGIKNALGPIENCGIDCNSPYHALLSVASIVEKSMGGTSGALYSLFLVSGVEHIKDSSTPMHWCKSLESGIRAIKRYGGADEGHRTMLDALCPATVALRKALEQNRDPKDALDEAIEAADEGSKKTAKMQAQAGRASYIGSSILSEPDPGAVGVVLWLKAINTALN